MRETDHPITAEDLRLSMLAARIDQLIGWAKVGAARECYLMKRENVDRLRNDVINVIVDELGEAVANTNGGDS